MSGEAAVDLCVNCYERTYRTVLAPGFFARVAAEQRFRFARRTAIVNNVHDRADAEARIEQLRASGELDAALFVSEHIGRALSSPGSDARISVGRPTCATGGSFSRPPTGRIG